MDIISEVRKLPNCGYTYCNLPGAGYAYKLVILGGNSCPSAEEYRFGRDIPEIIGKMENIYRKKLLSDDDKEALAKLMKNMLSNCEARTKGIYTLKQQEEYINVLTEEQKQEIEEQILMYKECYSFYLDYYRKR